jgi:hypothetical protein
MNIPRFSTDRTLLLEIRDYLQANNYKQESIDRLTAMIFSEKFDNSCEPTFPIKHLNPIAQW